MDTIREKRKVSAEELKQITGGESIPEDQLFSQYQEKLRSWAEDCRIAGVSREEAIRRLNEKKEAGFLGLPEITAIVDGIYQSLD